MITITIETILMYILLKKLILEKNITTIIGSHSKATYELRNRKSLKSIFPID